MKLEDFSKLFLRIVEHNLPVFETNMNRYNDTEHTFCEWADMFTRWMEIGNVEDCKQYYEIDK